MSRVDIDSFSGYASNPSGLVNDSQLLVGGYSNQLESIGITNSSNDRTKKESYKTGNMKGNKRTKSKGRKKSAEYKYERLQTQQYDDD